MICILDRKGSRFDAYKASTKECQFCKIQTLTFDEVKDNKGHINIFSYELYGIDNSCPMTANISLINNDFMKNLLKLNTSHIIECLTRKDVVGNNLLRFAYANQKWVTDGINLMNYHPAFDSRIKFTDTNTKYMMEQAQVINDKLIPMFILYLTNETDNTFQPQRYNIFKVEGIQEYEKATCFELLEITYNFYKNYLVDPRSVNKTKFIPILLCLSLISNGAFTGTELSSIVSMISSQTVDIMSVAEYLISSTTKGEVNFKYGVKSYYTPL